MQKSVAGPKKGPEAPKILKNGRKKGKKQNYLKLTSLFPWSSFDPEKIVRFSFFAAFLAKLPGLRFSGRPGHES